jgi:hypothetical protein
MKRSRAVPVISQWCAVVELRFSIASASPVNYSRAFQESTREHPETKHGYTLPKCGINRKAGEPSRTRYQSNLGTTTNGGTLKRCLVTAYWRVCGGRRDLDRSIQSPPRNRSLASFSETRACQELNSKRHFGIGQKPSSCHLSSELG